MKSSNSLKSFNVSKFVNKLKRGHFYKMNFTYLDVQRLSPTVPLSPRSSQSRVNTELLVPEDDLNNQDLSFQLSKSSLFPSQDISLPSALKSPSSKSKRSFVNSNKTISEKSFNLTFNIRDSPVDSIKHSEAATSPNNDIFGLCKENQIHFSSFATPNKIFCPNCEKDVYSVVRAKEQKRRIWNSFEQFLTILVCCEPKAELQKEMWHYCYRCNKVLAKVTGRL